MGLFPVPRQAEGDGSRATAGNGEPAKVNWDWVWPAIEELFLDRQKE